jgi:HD-GYP domain-containing protein (c-di-GMP phosphodiesterase class II)
VALIDKRLAATKGGPEMRRLKLENQKLRTVLYQTADSLASALEKRNPHTAGHQERVTVLSMAIASEMNLDEEVQEGIRLASTLQNIGMLNELEYELIKTHPEVGNKILENIEFPWPVSEIINQHHERMDGSGYPRGLKGEDILLEARILAVADVVEAMTSQRFHRPSLGIDKAIEEIGKNRSILYDPKVVDAFLKTCHEGKLLPSE